MRAIRRRPGTTAQQAGRDFESQWAEIVGGVEVPGSGNGKWRKLDVGDGTILWSSKFTDKRTFTVTPELMAEVDEGVRVQGTGMGALVINVGGELYTIMKANDMVQLLTDETTYIQPSRGEQKRLITKTPGLLRDDPE